MAVLATMLLNRSRGRKRLHFHRLKKIQLETRALGFHPFLPNTQYESFKLFPKNYYFSLAFSHDHKIALGRASINAVRKSNSHEHTSPFFALALVQGISIDGERNPQNAGAEKENPRFPKIEISCLTLAFRPTGFAKQLLYHTFYKLTRCAHKLYVAK
jgi:hypothetical protein